MRALSLLVLASLAACTPRDNTPRSGTITDSAGRQVVVDTLGDPPSRGDGRLENPPVHRTNPRDEDVMSPGTRATQGSSPDALLAEIERLARKDGCSRTGDCQTLPAGRKACGGPRTYVVYCATSTDVAALERKIAELDALDRAAAASGAVSDCMLMRQPTVTLSGGACRPAQ